METMTSIPDDVREFATRLFDMARNGDITLLDYVDQGVDADLSNEDGNSLLMFAAYHGHADLVTGLVGKGADVDKLNGRGQTPLSGAVFKKYDDVVDALVAAGADPHAGQPTAVQTAQMFEMTDTLKRLGVGE